eukprot:5615856-Amphidinium_carterae.1
MRGSPDQGPRVRLGGKRFTKERFKEFLMAVAPREGGTIGAVSYDVWKQFVAEEACWHNQSHNCQNVFALDD